MQNDFKKVGEVQDGEGEEIFLHKEVDKCGLLTTQLCSLLSQHTTVTKCSLLRTEMCGLVHLTSSMIGSSWHFLYFFLFFLFCFYSGYSALKCQQRRWYFSC